VITHSCRKYLINQRIKKKLRQPLENVEKNKMESSFYKYLSNFREVYRNVKSMYKVDGIHEEMDK
jgi:hypothetical protein